MDQRLPAHPRADGAEFRVPCIIVPRDRIAPMRSLLRRFLGARRPRMIAVVGICREDIEAGVEHAYTSSSGLPVWAWCAGDAEPVSGCDRFVARATASRIRGDLRQVWPALTIVSWTGQPGAWAVKLAPFTAPPFRIVIRNEAQGFFPARPGPLASHACRRLRDAATDRAVALGLWFYWRAYQLYSLAYRAAQRTRDAIRSLYSLMYRSAEHIRDVFRLLAADSYGCSQSIGGTFAAAWKTEGGKSPITETTGPCISSDCSVPAAGI